MKNYIQSSILTSMLLISFTACGGGDDGGTSIPITPTTNLPSTVTPVNKVSFSGIAVDGYISGATACLDLNVNGLCDISEPTSLTATDGTFTFTNVVVDENVLLPVIVTGGVDTATGKVFRGELKRIVDTKSINSSVKLNVTPLTDLVASSFIASNDKSDTVLTQKELMLHFL